MTAGGPGDIVDSRRDGIRSSQERRHEAREAETAELVALDAHPGAMETWESKAVCRFG